MKKITLLFLLLLIVSCGVKQTQSMLSNGDYDGAINRALEGLRTNKNSKGNQDYVYLLEEAFAKAKQRDLESLNLLIKENILQTTKKFLIFTHNYTIVKNA